MKIISGIVPLSLNDYPKEVSFVLFTQGCNLSCSYCFNKELISFDGGKYSIAEISDLISKRKNFISAVVITGGEPLLHFDEIRGLCSQVKKWGLKVKIDSNGLLPDYIARLIRENLIDKVGLDFKGNIDIYRRFLQEKYLGENGININDRKKIDFFLIKKYTEIYNLIRKYPDKFFLRTTVYKPDHSPEILYQQMKALPDDITWFLQSLNKKKLENNNDLITYKKNEISDLFDSPDMKLLRKRKRIKIMYDFQDIIL